MAFLHAGDSDGRTTLTVIWRRFHAGLPETHSPPGRWKRLLGDHPSDKEIERLLRTELTKAFGSSQALIREMNVKAVFKGVTYESLNDPEFMRIAGKKIPSLEVFHDEYDAAKAQGQLEI